MRWRSDTIFLPAVLLGSVLGAISAAAQEYCIACTAPDAVYRCVIDNAQPGGVTPLQVMCLNAMAKAGGHASCAIKRGTVFDCKGPLKRVPWVANDQVPDPLPPPKSKSEQADPREPPATVLDMADRANKKSAEDMKKAGEAVKDGAETLGDGVTKATKKTWDCLTSLFAKC